MEATMISLARETVRLSTSLLTRGILMMILGLVAFSWPDVAVARAMFTAAAILALLGACEVFIALRSRRATRGWMIPMADGAACIGFAVLTLVLPYILLNVTLLLVAIWLVLYAALTGALALALWPMPRTRFALIGWTVLNLTLALLALTLPQATIVAVLYVGAGYAVTFGALQVASGLWIRRIAVPYVEPPIQSRWVVARREFRAARADFPYPSDGSSSGAVTSSASRASRT
jgi:uncharacterized membrane protein HdeD (DUF308 family)